MALCEHICVTMATFSCILCVSLDISAKNRMILFIFGTVIILGVADPCKIAFGPMQTLCNSGNIFHICYGFFGDLLQKR